MSAVGLYPCLAVDDSDNVYISYHDAFNGLKFAKSTDGGSTWPAGNIKLIDY